MLRCCRMGAAAQGCILPSSERLLLPGHPAGGAWEVVRHRQVLHPALTVLLLLPSLACPPALPHVLPCSCLVPLPSLPSLFHHQQDIPCLCLPHCRSGRSLLQQRPGARRSLQLSPRCG